MARVTRRVRFGDDGDRARNGSRRPLRDEGDAYGEAALRAAGVRAEVQRYDGMSHGFFDMGTISPAAQKAIEESCARFGDLLGAA